MSPRIALATCKSLPEPDPDADLLLSALKAEGAEAAWLAWDDPAADFRGWDLCVIRSTWNYIHDLTKFLQWAKRADKYSGLLNPWRIVRWNTDKGYLRDLQARGVPTVPTLYIDRGASPALKDLLAPTSWSDVVVKPRVGAGSFSTRRFAARDYKQGTAFLAALAAEREALVQPYLKSVEEDGERALVWVAGKVTHAVRKAARFSGQEEEVSKALRPTPEERAFVKQVLAPWQDELLYARVDVARDDQGRLVLMELELVEPSLFLKQCPEALERLVDGCLDAAA